MERKILKPLKIVIYASFVLYIMPQECLSKPPLPQYREIGSFMAQPNTNSNVNMKSPTINEYEPVRNDKLQTEMTVPSYNVPYSKVPVTKNVPVVNSMPPVSNVYSQKQVHSIDNTSADLKPSQVRPIQETDRSIKNITTKDDYDKNSLNSNDVQAKKNTQANKQTTFKLGLQKFLKSLNTKSVKLKESFKNRRASKKNINSDDSSVLNNENFSQTVFEPDPVQKQDMSANSYTKKPMIQKPVLANKQPSSMRKSIVPTPALADTMIFNNISQSTDVPQSKVSTSGAFAKQTNHVSNVVGESESLVNRNFDSSVNDVSVNISTTNSFKNDNAELKSNSNSAKSDVTKNNDIKNKEDGFFAKLKKDEGDVPSKNSLSQDKLDAYDEIRDYAKVLYNANKLDESVAEFNSIPDADKISDDWLFLANISQDNNKIDDAIFYLKKAIQLDDNNYKAHYNLGNIYLLQNKINSALSEYKKVNKIKKDFSYAYYNKGCCYLKINSYFNARYEFGLAIKYNPDDPVFYYNLAYTNKMMKKEKKAQEALDMYNKLMNE